TAVDRAESEPELAYAVNRDGVANLAAACRESDIPLIHISTDYVFDGQQSTPYAEEDPVNPMGVYGASKLAGERVLETELEQHIVIRTAWVYGAHGHNFVKTMLRLGREKESLSVVADQYGCPTSAPDIAETVLNISQQVYDKGNRVWGMYHYVAEGITTWHEFAAAVFDEGRRYENLCVRDIRPISTSEYPTPARRPSNSALDCTKIKQVFNIDCKPWRQSLRGVIKEMYT
ncbi:MAG: dTDP-4-dehydrorhamnose reductase, partial [Mariprofundaceae bacterium]